MTDAANAAPAPGNPAVVDPPPASPAPAPDLVNPAGENAAPPAVDWATIRSQYAKGDEKLEKRLARYSSQSDALDALIEAQNKIASGNLKEKLPDNATEEQRNNWRKDQGLPVKVDEFQFKAPAGIEFDDADKAVLAGFAQAAFEGDMTPAQAQKAIDWYYANQEREITEMRQQDAAFRKESEDVLRGEWGSEYRLNVNLVSGLLDAAPAGLKEKLLGSRLGTGEELGSHPDVMRWLASMARQINPVATVVPSGGNSMQVIESEMASLEKLMGDRKSAYWKGPEAAKMQQRYRDLVSVKNKLK